MDGITVALISVAIKLVGVLLAVWFKGYLESRSSSNATLTIVLFALVGLTLGAVSGGLRLQFQQAKFYHETFAAEIILGIACLVLAIEHIRSRAGFWKYELHVLALWGTFIGAWLTFHGSYSDNFVPPAVSAYASCAVVGGLLVAIFKGPARS
jgi:hypothetical protein